MRWKRQKGILIDSIFHLKAAFESMIKAVEAEKAKLGLQRQTLQEIRQRLRAKKQKVEDQRKALQTAAKMLSKAELAFEQKLDEIESINQVKLTINRVP